MFSFACFIFACVCVQQCVFISTFALCRRIRFCVSVFRVNTYMLRLSAPVKFIHDFACFNRSNVLSSVVWMKCDCGDRRSAAGYSRTNCLNFLRSLICRSFVWFRCATDNKNSLWRDLAAFIAGKPQNLLLQLFKISLQFKVYS